MPVAMAAENRWMNWCERQLEPDRQRAEKQKEREERKNRRDEEKKKAHIRLVRQHMGHIAKDVKARWRRELRRQQNWILWVLQHDFD